MRFLQADIAHDFPAAVRPQIWPGRMWRQELLSSFARKISKGGWKLLKRGGRPYTKNTGADDELNNASRVRTRIRTGTRFETCRRYSRKIVYLRFLQIGIPGRTSIFCGRMAGEDRFQSPPMNFLRTDGEADFITLIRRKLPFGVPSGGWQSRYPSSYPYTAPGGQRKSKPRQPKAAKSSSK